MEYTIEIAGIATIARKTGMDQTGIEPSRPTTKYKTAYTDNKSITKTAKAAIAALFKISPSRSSLSLPHT